MSWIDKLYQTYENCADCVGRVGDEVMLLPVGHTTNKVQLEIALTAQGEFRAARFVPKSEAHTPLPCTEDSGGRSNGISSHPLVDKLEYVAADFSKYGSPRAAPKNDKTFSSEFHYAHYCYRSLLDQWCSSPFRHPKVAAVQEYIHRGHVIEDLISAQRLPIDPVSGQVLDESPVKNGKHPIFELLDGQSTPLDSFVRWSVEIPGDLQPQLWLDRSVWNSWVNFQKSTMTEVGLCYVTGEEATLAAKHPAKLRSSGDKAKLISANDSSGFTFRGRFSDDTGEQACGVGFEITQKAHSALRWLIARQGRRDGTQAIVTWSVDGKLDDDPLSDSRSLLFSQDEIAKQAQAAKTTKARSDAHLAQDFALRLNRKIGGYKAALGDASDIMILALDSATPGRMSVNYYRELNSSEFIERIERWHYECCWIQNFGNNARFVGAPSPKDIAETAYDRRLDDKLLGATVRQLLPCIIDAVPIPRNLIESCVRRASNRNGIEHWEWEKALGIACALYRKQHTKQRNYQMALELDRDSRDYLFGRLLALAEGLEERALYVSGEKRETNAGRLMQRFADNPCSTWRTIETALVPYIARLQVRRPPFLFRVRTEIDAVMDKFRPNDFTSPAKLSGEFLLGYHCQRSALRFKPNDEDEDSDKEENSSD